VFARSFDVIFLLLVCFVRACLRFAVDRGVDSTTRYGRQYYLVRPLVYPGRHDEQGSRQRGQQVDLEVLPRAVQEEAAVVPVAAARRRVTGTATTAIAGPLCRLGYVAERDFLFGGTARQLRATVRSSEPPPVPAVALEPVEDLLAGGLDVTLRDLRLEHGLARTLVVRKRFEERLNVVLAGGGLRVHPVGRRGHQLPRGLNFVRDAVTSILCLCWQGEQSVDI
jgi:hypothetical protein